MVFPYKSYYPNQKETIECLSKAVGEGKNFVFESPTGSGKTIAVLSSLIPLAKKKRKTVLYLCRTHEQMDRVIEELKMVSKNISVKGLSLRSRRAMCLNEFIIDNTQSIGEERFACSVLKKEGKCSYYKNLKNGQTVRFEKPMTASEFRASCEASKICPYEFSKNLLSDCDVIACSYLYIFEPGIRASFLNSTDKALGDFILILDEAHNLPRLAVEIGSQRLTEFAVSGALKEAEDYQIPHAKNFLKRLDRFLLESTSKERRISKSELLKHIGEDLSPVHQLEDFGEEIRKKRLAQGKRPVSFLHACALFVRNWAECSEEGFAFFTSRTEKGTPLIEVLSLDPTGITKPVLNETYLTVHMSGTLTPTEAYCDVIGLENYISKSFPSPFPKENITALVDPSVSTLGSLRTPEMYERIAKRIESIVSVIPGNVLVFFPSYVVLNSVLAQGIEVAKQAFSENRGMTSTENNDMIKSFKQSKNAVLYGVQQGRNSEGQDFPGEQANAVIIVGIPYAMKGPKVNAQIEYYKKMYTGWWGRYPLGEYYAYFLPAYRSLNQSAGRAHRSLTDRAAIIFLEKRVGLDRKVHANIARWIKENMRISINIENDVEEFYTSNR